MRICDNCGEIIVGKAFASIREIETGRSSGSSTFGVSNSSGSNNKGTSSNRRRNSYSFNTGRKYYRNIRVVECEPCYTQRKKSETNQLIGIVITIVVLALILFIAITMRTPSKNKSVDMQWTPNTVNVEQTIPAPRQVVRENISCLMDLKSVEWASLTRRVDNGNSSSEDDSIYKVCFK